MKPAKAQPKSHARGVVFEEVLTVDLEEDEVLSEPKSKTTSMRKSKYVTAFHFFVFMLIHIAHGVVVFLLPDHPNMRRQITQMTRTMN